MVIVNTRTKTRAEMLAKGARRAGKEASFFKKKKGYGVSINPRKRR